MKTIFFTSLFLLMALSSAMGFLPIRTADNTKLALGGYDPVVYYAEELPRMGSITHTLVYDGVEWRFEDRTNKLLFQKHPEMFIPAFGGYCAYGITEGEVIAEADPRAFVVYDGKLYFFHNAALLKLWNENPKAFIARAEKEWQKLIKSGQISSGNSEEGEQPS